jgi:hypothetical protein
LEDVARAKEADNQYADWLRTRMYGDGGFMTLEGRNAVDSRAAFDKEAADKQREFGKALPPGAASKYSTASRARLQSVYQESVVHTANQRKTWFKEASGARAATFADDALVKFDRPALVTKSIAAGVMELGQQAQLEGWDASKLNLATQDYVSGIHKNIALRIAQDDPIAADKYIKDHSAAMTGANQYEVNQALDTAITEEKSKREADAILQGGRTDPAANAGGVAGNRAVGQTGPTNTRAFLTDRLVTKGRTEDVDGLDAAFATNIAALLQDAPPGIREGLGITSGFRSYERQQALYQAELAKQGGNAAAARHNEPQ